MAGQAQVADVKRVPLDNSLIDRTGTVLTARIVRTLVRTRAASKGFSVKRARLVGNRTSSGRPATRVPEVSTATLALVKLARPAMSPISELVR